VIDPLGLAPEGWRIPKDEDWQILEKKFGAKIRALSLKLKIIGVMIVMEKMKPGKK
jgi:uncharacterized protein (TIGR02145 family)